MNSMPPSPPEWVYVLARNGGCDGHSPPIQAFRAHDEAERAKALIEAAGDSARLEIFQVPVWPNPASAPWHSIKPVQA